jgi:hypothetical protein
MFALLLFFRGANTLPSASKPHKYLSSRMFQDRLFLALMTDRRTGRVTWGPTPVRSRFGFTS